MAGNARFHNKLHRRNHHTLPSVGYPDSGTDPIASPAEPFQGDFGLNGSLSGTGNLVFDGNGTFLGNLSVYGDFSYFETYVTISSALSVINNGTGPALTVVQAGDEPVARFIDKNDGCALFIEDNGQVTINTCIPPGQVWDPNTNTLQNINLTLGGIMSASGAIRHNTPTSQVIFVSQSGNDSFSGLNPSQALRTIKKAAKIAFDKYYPRAVTIFVDAGRYVENNPIYLPARTTVIGNNLRSVDVIPYNKREDIFWCNNGCYIWGVTFREHYDPCAATAFPQTLSGTLGYNVAYKTPGYEISTTRVGPPFGLPIVSKPYITTSPYTQGNSSIARFLTLPLSSVAQSLDPELNPGVNAIGSMQGCFDTIVDIIYNGTDSTAVSTFRITEANLACEALLKANKEYFADAVINFINTTYPGFVYDQIKCYRDVGYIIDCVSSDLVIGSTLSSVNAGNYYWNGVVSLIEGQEQQTSAAIKYLRNLATSFATNAGALQVSRCLGLIDDIKFIINNGLNFVPASSTVVDYPGIVESSLYTTVSSNINSITTIITGGLSAAPAVTNYYYNNPLVTFTLSGRFNGLIDDVITIISQGLTAVPAVSSFSTSTGLLSSEFLPVVSAAIDNITYIIQNGTTILPTASSYVIPSGKETTIKSILKFKSSAQSLVVNYINNKYPSFVYDKEKCYRDVGYIVDAIVNDIANENNGSSIEAGVFYWDGATSLIPGQQIETVDAINYLYKLLQLSTEDITTISNLNAFKPALQSSVISYVNVNFPNFVYNKEKCYRDVAFIIDAISMDVTNGNNIASLSAGKYYWNGATSLIPGQQTETVAAINHLKKSFLASPEALNSVYSLYEYKPELQAEIVAFVNRKFSSLVYDQAKCFRDVGYVVDALVSDLSEGTNSSSLSCGRYYWSGATTLIPGEQVQTVAAMNQLIKLTSSSSSILDAIALINRNKNYLQTETVSYVNRVYPGFAYDATLCFRDVGLILENIKEDLTNNNNVASLSSGQAYWNGTTSLIPNQARETIGALDHLRYLLTYVLKNTTVENLNTGCGIRVDGEKATGFLRSFVTDSFTQFNEGGIGIHIINCGYAQLVSTFTICCTEGVKCESGGNCSISTSNCSFGLSGLAAIGKSKFPVLTGNFTDFVATGNNEIIISDITPRPFTTAYITNPSLTSIPVNEPYKGLLVKITDDPNSYYNKFVNPNAETFYHVIESVSAYPMATLIDSDVYANIGSLIGNINFIINYGLTVVPLSSNFTPTSGIVMGDPAVLSQLLLNDITTIINNGLSAVPPVSSFNFPSSITSGSVSGRAAGLIEDIITIINNGLSAVPALSTFTPDTGLINLEVTEKIDFLLGDITYIINNGVSILPPTSSFTVSPYTSAAIAALNTYRTNLQTLVVNYVNYSFPGFVYDQDKCFRDVGFIIDALITDLNNGNNLSSIDAGSFYWNGATSLIPGQQTETVAAVNYLGTLTKLSSNTLNTIISWNKYKPTLQRNVVNYVDYSYPGFVYNQNKCFRDVGYLIDAVSIDIASGNNNASLSAGKYYFSGSTSLIPGQQLQTTGAINHLKKAINTSTDVLSSLNSIEQYKTKIQNSVVSYVDRTYANPYSNPPFVYNKDKCFRDVGYILNALAIDMTEGNNIASLSAGKYYFSGNNSLISGQQLQTTDAINHINKLFNVAGETLDAIYLINTKKTFLQDNVVYFVDSKYPGFNYNRNICYRDVGLLSDCIVTDLTYNNNHASLDAGRSYWNGATSKIAGQQNETVAAINYLYELMKFSDPNRYLITFEKNITFPISANPTTPKYVEFYLRSQITTSSHAFEYIGTGVELAKAVPALGGVAHPEWEAVFSDGGIVYYTSTNEGGEFKVGPDFTIVQALGRIKGRAFDKGILALVTPLILGLE